MSNESLIIKAIKYIEPRLGKIILIEEINNQLEGKLTKQQIREELRILSKKNKIIFLKKKYIQRVSLWKRIISRFKK